MHYENQWFLSFSFNNNKNVVNGLWNTVKQAVWGQNNLVLVVGPFWTKIRTFIFAFSPYIPGECVVSLSDGSCYQWQGERLRLFADTNIPRFRVSDLWNHVHYGSHPKQIIYCDQTALQIMDLRVKLMLYSK